VDWNELLRALALVLVIEGVMPFLAPRRWRGFLLQVAALDERTLRVTGFLLIAAGAIALNFL
jgi:uncharacterized protein